MSMKFVLIDVWLVVVEMYIFSPSAKGIIYPLQVAKAENLHWQTENEMGYQTLMMQKLCLGIDCFLSIPNCLLMLIQINPEAPDKYSYFRQPSIYQTVIPFTHCADECQTRNH